MTVWRFFCFDDIETDNSLAFLLAFFAKKLLAVCFDDIDIETDIVSFDNFFCFDDIDIETDNSLADLPHARLAELDSYNLQPCNLSRFNPF